MDELKKELLKTLKQLYETLECQDLRYCSTSRSINEGFACGCCRQRIGIRERMQNLQNELGL